MTTRKSKLEIKKYIQEESQEKERNKSSQKKESSNLLNELIKEDTPREKPIRVSLDLTPEMHRKLTALANRTGRKKSEILRILLEQAFDEINIE